MNSINLTASSSIIRKQIISVYISNQMVEEDVDVVEVMICTESGRPRTVVLPRSFFSDSRRAY